MLAYHNGAQHQGGSHTRYTRPLPCSRPRGAATDGKSTAKRGLILLHFGRVKKRTRAATSEASRRTLSLMRQLAAATSHAPMLPLPSKAWARFCTAPRAMGAVAPRERSAAAPRCPQAPLPQHQAVAGQNAPGSCSPEASAKCGTCLPLSGEAAQHWSPTMV